MPQEKVDASRHNGKVAPKNNPPSGSKTPQTPHHGGGGSPYPESLNDLDLDNHQTINHNHCPLDDCELFTEHRFPAAIAEHIEYFFGFLGGADGLTRYGPDVVNKSIAYMKYKREKEDFIPDKPGGFLRRTCEKFLAGGNVPTGADGAIIHARFKNYQPFKVDDRNKYIEEYERRRGPLKRS